MLNKFIDKLNLIKRSGFHFQWKWTQGKQKFNSLKMINATIENLSYVIIAVMNAQLLATLRNTSKGTVGEVIQLQSLQLQVCAKFHLKYFGREIRTSTRHISTFTFNKRNYSSSQCENLRSDIGKKHGTV